MDKPESYLVYQTLRDMNLSKLVAQDVPLFLSILADLLIKSRVPGHGTSIDGECEKPSTPKAEYPEGDPIV